MSAENIISEQSKAQETETVYTIVCITITRFQLLLRLLLRQSV